MGASAVIFAIVFLQCGKLAFSSQATLRRELIRKDASAEMAESSHAVSSDAVVQDQDWMRRAAESDAEGMPALATAQDGSGAGESDAERKAAFAALEQLRLDAGTRSAGGDIAGEEVIEAVQPAEEEEVVSFIEDEASGGDDAAGAEESGDTTTTVAESTTEAATDSSATTDEPTEQTDTEDE
eukprot:TRINITY_DN67005_c0_g1_i1.p2 TRINITY_DN67005_c0_g1~~TRINITY_DN67005_c0_g1_i1.p2  ORF type:complete len:183 (+),score=55.37 TRINITY_DN67005_c0_g1_i1:124-672(+)